MKVPYRDNMPIVEVVVRGPRGEMEYEAYLDTGAGRSLFPESDAVELGLPYAGDTTAITGSGRDSIKLYRATIALFDREYSTLIFGRDLPEEAPVRAFLGRDILDKFRVCFDKARVLEII